MIASVLVGKLCVIAAVAAVALVLEVVVPILRLKLLARRLAEDEKVGKVEGVDEVEKVDEVEGVEKVERVERVEVLGSKFQVLGDGFQVGGVEAEKIWAEACGMTPSENPSFATDWRYMTLLHKAAELGHAGAMSALGDIAFRRGAFVEAFFWKWKVESGGGTCVEPSLEEIRADCLASGALTDPGETGGNYGVEEDDFARAVVAVQSGLDMGIAMRRLKELAECGVEEAQLFLNGSSRASQKS